MSESFLAEIRMFGGDFAPQGWAFCHGQRLPISQNQALFSLLGTNFGGDGETDFALPDLRGRVPVQQGSGPGLSTIRLGETGGVERMTINPAHTHSYLIESQSGVPTVSSPAAAAPAGLTRDHYASVPDGSLGSGNTSQTGPAAGLLVRSPYHGIHFIIALTGIFPSRP